MHYSTYVDPSLPPPPPPLPLPLLPPSTAAAVFLSCVIIMGRTQLNALGKVSMYIYVYDRKQESFSLLRCFPYIVNCRKRPAVLLHPVGLPAHREGGERALLLRAVEPQRVQVHPAVPQDPFHLLAGVHHGQVQRAAGQGARVHQGQGQDLLPGEGQGVECRLTCLQHHY